MASPITVHLAEAAWNDLEDLVNFLLTQGDATAPALIDFLFDGLRVLTHQPGIGRPADQGLRELVLHRGKSGYIVKYRYLPERAAVRVLRIRHQRQTGYTEREI